MSKRIAAMTFMLLCVFGLIWGGAGCVAFAEAPSVENTFSGEVSVLKQEGGSYVMQVTVENSGGDFTGTVQAVFGSSYENCAYNTEMTLPAQGRKQFTITVPERAMDLVYGLCALNFLDEKGEVLQSIQLKGVLGDMKKVISVGILSDDYSSLTYMDAGGEPLYTRGLEYPLDLMELNNDNLQGYLNGLYFLVIDQFNVASLSGENIQAIQDWVADGGWLIIGTGAYAEQTLSGFDETFLDVDVTDVSEPGEENLLALNALQNGYYYDYRYADIDFTQMAVADLDFNRMHAYGTVSESGESPAVCFSVEDGVTALFYCSLGEKELQKLEDYMILNFYREIMYNSNSYQASSRNMDMEYTGQRALAYIDSCNSNVDFSWLKMLILVYVVLVGPVLYLVLRKCKKSEWYWVAAPVLGISFIAGVYFFGQNIRVTEARVYSVTVQQVDGNQADTYFLAYHSGVKPWMVRLNDGYEAAGPGFLGYSYSNSSSAINDYHYIVSSGSEGMSVGIKPRGNFENAFLYAGKKSESKGTFTSRDLTGSMSGGLSGTVTNETASDLAYMAVWWGDSYIMVFSDVKAGETIDLQQASADGRCVYQTSTQYFDNLLHDMVGIYYNYKEYKQDDMAALLICLGMAGEKKPLGDTVIAGVVENYDKAVADKCSEMSFGCFYSFVQSGTEDTDGEGGGQNASN